MSRKTLAQLSGVGYSTIAEIENGRMHTSTRVHALAEVLNVRDTWLATGKGPRERGDTLSDTARFSEEYLPSPPPAWMTTSPSHARLAQSLDRATRSGALSPDTARSLASLVDTLQAPAAGRTPIADALRRKTQRGDDPAS